MALATYTDLQAAAASWLHRSDLTARVPDFIALAEAKMNRRLRTRQMIFRADAQIGDEYSAVPDDFLGAIAVSIANSPPVRLTQFTPDQIESLAQGQETGSPRYYSVVGQEFRFYPVPGAEYPAKLTYYQMIPALSDSNATNWMLTNHPDAYLYGTLLEAAPYLKDDARISIWAELYTTVLADIEAADKRESQGGQLAQMASGFVA